MYMLLQLVIIEEIGIVEEMSDKEEREGCIRERGVQVCIRERVVLARERKMLLYF